MPIVSRLAVLSSKAWGQFKTGIANLASNYLYSWGANSYGKLGSFYVASGSSSPVQIGGLKFQSISKYGSSTMAVGVDGALYAWGQNNSGSLGDGTTVSQSVAVRIGTLTDWKYVSIGVNNSYAVKTDGTLWSWGLNNIGQLGDGTTINKSSPIQIGTQANWSVVKAYESTVLALKTDGTLWGWGKNGDGQIGDGTAVAKSSPVQVGTLSVWKDFGVGSSHTVAIRTNGSLWAWGANAFGQLGDNTTTGKISPVQIGTLTNWSSINTGNNTNAAIKTDGSLWVWGLGQLGALGDGTTNNKSSPVQLGTLTTWVDASIGSLTGRAEQSNGSMWVWGYNINGQLGLNDTTDRSSPVQVTGVTSPSILVTNINNVYNTGFVDQNNLLFSSGDGTFMGRSLSSRSRPGAVGIQGSLWAALSISDQNALAVSKDRKLFAWGRNNSGQLGTGNTIDYSGPIQVGTLSNWKSVTTRASSGGIAIKTDGTLWAWGNNSSSVNFGIGGGGTSFPQVYGNNYPITAAAAGLPSATSGVIAFISNGKLYTAGLNSNGQLGIGNTTDQTSPVQVGTLSNWLKVATTTTSMAAVKNDGTLWAWGQNNIGQLGDGTTINKSSPIQIGTLTHWTNVFNRLGEAMYYGLTTSGTMFSWGSNGNGALGIGLGNTNFTVNISTPQVYGSDTWSNFKTGNSFAVGVKSNGTLWAWGLNSSGQLGDGTTLDKTSPIQIGTQTDWDKLHPSSGYTAAIKDNGTLWMWGSGAQGQFGLGGIITPATNYSSLVQLPSVANFTTLGSPSYTNMAASSSAGMFTWGLTTPSYPAQIDSSSNWSVISLGFENNILAIKADGTLWGTGANNVGQLGIGNTVTQTSFVQVGTLSNWAYVASSFSAAIAVKTDGTLWSWGAGTGGILGTGSTVNVSSPVQIGTLTNWAWVSASGANAGFAITTTNQLYAWGNATSVGQLGLGSTVSYSSPVQVGTLTNWSRVYGGLSVTMAVKTDGTLWSWGLNTSGQLGDGSTINKSSPVQIGTVTTWLKASSSGSNSLGLKDDGTAWSWGNNNVGQLADGTTVNKSSPVQIGTLSTWVDGNVLAGGQPVLLDTSNNIYTAGGSANAGLRPPSSSFPIQVGTDTWLDVAVSPSYVMGIKSDGSLWTSGNGSTVGSLGLNAVSSVTTFSRIGTLSGWSSVSTTFESSYGVRSGRLFAWGAGAGGALGIGSTVNQSSPVQVGTLTNWSQVATAAGASFMSAIKSDGTLWAWGLNSSGQLGDNSTTSKSSPVQVGTLTNWAKSHIGAAVAFHINTSNQMYYTGAATNLTGVSNPTLWIGEEIVDSYGYNTGETSTVYGGVNNYGAIIVQGTNNPAPNMQVPSGNVTYSSPVQIPIYNDWVNPGLTTSGKIRVWGAAGSGQTGLNNTANKAGPITLDFNTWQSYSRSAANSSAVRTTGEWFAWGLGNYYAIGDGTSISRSSPVQIGTLTNWVKAVVGNSNGYAINSIGELYGCGSKNTGDGTTALRASPVKALFDAPISDIYAGNSLAMAKAAYDDVLLTFGELTAAQTTPTTGNSSPIQIGEGTNWGSKPFMLGAIRDDGSLWTWGTGTSGQLGTGDTFNRTGPTRIGTLTDWSIAQASPSFAVAIKTNGTLWAWGANSQGQLGNNSTTPTSSPIQIGTLTWKSISTGLLNTLAVRNDGTLWAWGYNHVGQLGIGDTTNRSSPVQIGTLSTWTKVSSIDYTSFAIKSDGTLWAWGLASSGQLGDNSTTNKSSPVQVGTLTSWVDLPPSNPLSTDFMMAYSNTP